jgi:hypothetical protein
LANRIAAIAPVTKELLTTLEADDIAMPDVVADIWKDLDSPSLRFRVACVGCGKSCRVPLSYLGRRVQCRECQHKFRADWGEVEKESQK